MAETDDFPAWHPAALGEHEDLPGRGNTSGAPSDSVGTPYTGKAAPSAVSSEKEYSQKKPPTAYSASQKPSGARPRKRYREGYKKGFRKPKTNPKSPFAPAFGAEPQEKTPQKKRTSSSVQFRADSRLAETESPLIQGNTSRGQRRGRGKEPESEFTQAKNIVLNQLAASAKSRAQLEKKLKDKEISEDTAQDVLDRFEAVKLINDEEFAHMYVRTRANVKKLSKTAIRRELREKGVNGELAEVALEQRTEEDERADAHELVRKKMRPSMDFSDRKEKDKIMRRLVSMLARKGYPSSMAFSVVKEEIDRFIEDSGIESADTDDYFF